MTRKTTSDTTSQPVRLSERFASSARFKAMFKSGMDLVEESAAFLDGHGRELARSLPRNISVLYASESMRLTTRLMQMASWLLLQRALGEGELTREQLLSEKQKVKFDRLETSARTAEWKYLPAEFVELVDRSLALQDEVRRLDEELFNHTETGYQPQENPVSAQLALLSTALGARISA